MTACMHEQGLVKVWEHSDRRAFTRRLYWKQSAHRAWQTSVQNTL